MPNSNNPNIEYDAIAESFKMRTVIPFLGAAASSIGAEPNPLPLGRELAEERLAGVHLFGHEVDAAASHAERAFWTVGIALAHVARTVAGVAVARGKAVIGRAAPANVPLAEMAAHVRCRCASEEFGDAGLCRLEMIHADGWQQRVALIESSGVTADDIRHVELRRALSGQDAVARG